MYDEDDYQQTDYLDPRKRFAAPGVHIMNKDESKMMRRLVSQTGLSEEDVRKHKKYRIMLAKARNQSTFAKRTELQKTRDSVMKEVCRKLKLAKEHPTVIKAFWDEWMLRRNRSTGFYGSIYDSNPGVEKPPKTPKVPVKTKKACTNRVKKSMVAIFGDKN